MGGSFTSWNALKSALQKEMYAALDEATENSFENLKENVSHFYDAPEGRYKRTGYKRTGQLMASPQLDGINHNGNSAISQISINTGTQYDPAGRDTETIYEYAEDGGLLGYGGFWEKTNHEIRKNIANSFGKRF